ncbi:MAG: cAMP receptor protein [Pelotomaculum sp. PtaU1.Bin035]|nr:MAG: cAMP receptor protein [Pelotomaculum sp. PtaU1.Bin035]
MIDVSKISLFNGLDREELDRVTKKVVERIYPKGATIFVEGQETDGLYIVTSGLIKVLKLHKDGREKTLAILNKGDILGEMTLFGSNLRTAIAETLEQTTVLVIPKANFQSLLLEIPKIAIRVIETLSSRLKQANRQIEELTFLSARSRVICNLINLAKEYGQPDRGGIAISLQLTHAELANLVGISRETMTKVLAGLQDSKLIKVTRKKIQIINQNDLHRQVM